MSDIDVLIVGAGPTGLALALELAAEGTSFRIVDKASKASELSRGLTLQPRTLELLNRHADVRTGLMAPGIENFGTTIWMNRKPILKTVVTEKIHFLNTAFTWPILISQHKLELFMADALAKYGSKVERNLAARNIAQDKDGVQVVLEKSDGAEETIRAKYVVGCDGSRSVVRNAAKAMKFSGASYSESFILCDALIDSSKSTTDLEVQQMHVCVGDGMLVSFPLENGKRRIFASRTEGNIGKDLTLDEFQLLLADFLPGGDKMVISDPDWLSVFNVHHKMADKYRDGRLFVAGDAAHIHSPAGGQGGNTSIQDAVNLGWKLAAVLRGEKPERFLDTYHEERHPIGQTLLAHSDQRLSFVCSKNPVFLFFRNLLVPYLLPVMDKVSPQKLANFDNQLRVKYRRSSIVGTSPNFTGKIRGGHRVIDGAIRNATGRIWFQELFTAGSHHLVLFSGLQASSSEKELQNFEDRFSKVISTKSKVHNVYKDHSKGYVDVDGNLHKQFGFAKQAGYIFIRPDGYIGYIGYLSSFDGFLNWLKQ